MGSFAPIAIIGRGCVVPGAADPTALWQLILEGRNALGPVPEGRWRADRTRILRRRENATAEGAVTDRGGFVAGFDDVFRPGDFLLPPETVAAGDRLLRWLLYASHQALGEAHLAPGARVLKGAGAVFGNLSYPNDSLARFAEDVWRGVADPARATERFNGGLPVAMLCAALGLGRGGFALDAACASSLYAIKLACDRLQTGAADVMVAGAVNAIDPLVLHAGFSALGAISPSGQSRPFHAAADGLVPAEGAVALVLKRYADAKADGNRILGVIRGIGLSNDGRAGGILAPAAAGQETALRRALTGAGIAPADIGYVECHATGTQVGDAVELAALAHVFGADRSLPVGSLKANLGHLVTASGGAGLLKMLAAFEHGVLPPCSAMGPYASALSDTAFRVVARAEPWPSRGRVVAGISSFGFGGTNAHLIVESPETYVPETRPPAISMPGDIAVIGIGLRAKGNAAQWTAALREGQELPRDAEIALPLAGLRIPPNDLGQSVPAHALVLAAAADALADITVPTDTAVLIGAQCDADACRHAYRLRLPELEPVASLDAVGVGPMTAAHVVGCMPNMPANRLNAQWDLRGPSFTIQAEDLSGLAALTTAAQWLRTGEIDAAVVGAADAPDEVVTQTALGQMMPGVSLAAGAVCLVLKRADDARRDGNPILALLAEADDDPADRVAWAAPQAWTQRVFGYAHAAAGLLDVAVAGLCLAHGVLPRGDGPPVPWLAGTRPRRAAVSVASPLMGMTEIVRLREGDSAATSARARTSDLVRVYEGTDVAALRRALADDTPLPLPTPPPKGPRAAMWATDAADAAACRAELIACLDNGTMPAHPRAVLQRAPVAGDVAFVFTGAAAAYRGMGRDLLLAVPELATAVQEKCAPVRDLAGWIYDLAPPPHVGDYPLLTASSFLCQAHAVLTREILAISPQAVLGLSSGETNALFAFDAWQDMAGLMNDVRTAGLYDTVLSGAYAAVHAAWRNRGITPESWETWQVLAPADVVRDALKAHPGASLAIITAPEDCIIAGAASACRGVVAALRGHRAMQVNVTLACHTPDIGAAAELWHRLHDRPTKAPAGVRFYSNAHNASYALNRCAVADALTRQAATTVDFPTTVRQAWADGVRVFIEHGPRNVCTEAIKAILGDRPHVAVALDRFGTPALDTVREAVLRLHVAGVPVQHEGLCRSISPSRPAVSAAPILRLPLHWPAMPRIDTAVAAAPEARILPLPPRLAPPRLTVPHPKGASWHAAAIGHGPAAAIARIHAAATAHHLGYMRTAAQAHERYLALVAGARPANVDAVAASGRPTVTVSAPPTAEPVPLFSRRDLERLAGDPLSDVWGEAFAQLDDVPRIVRMPLPPLLLADRVISLDAPCGRVGTGTVVTETDVSAESWYVHHGHMPAGLAVEAGQADLLLISWMGIDFLNRGARVYRLLGCDLTYHGGLPAVGETLRYDIAIDGHSALGDVRLFFFKYDCTVAGARRMSVRNGQAGFFTDRELAESDGVLWSAATATPKARDACRLDPPPAPTAQTAFDRAALEAFAAGDLAACFGERFREAACHTRTPAPPSGRMLLLERVTDLALEGGPWGRGYLRAEWPVRPDDWFFDGHFKNDPCMPGTLMFEACLQAMSVYMAALGVTLPRDGWRFEPVPEETFRLRCRGQVTPQSRLIVYEVFVEEFAAGPVPTLWADVLCTVDGLKAFHCPRLALRLVPDWPMDAHTPIEDPDPARPVAVAQGFAFDHRALIACALGRPSAAFGPFYGRFDDGTRVPRLPGPPYHFMTRVTQISGEIGGMSVGSAVVAEYDVPAEAWYFAATPGAVMPYAVLMEVGLQPCGWLASYVGAAQKTEEEVFFRNLDGTARVHRAVSAGAGRLVTTAQLTRLSRSGAMTIVAFDVTTADAEGPVHTMETVFGFFPAAALAAQAGLPVGDAERTWHDAADHAPLALAGTCWGAWVAGDELLMLTRISGWWPEAGSAGLGVIRGEKQVDPAAWFFKAHFFQDPVQPGSLGVEAMLQLLKADLLRRGLAGGAAAPVFTAVSIDEEIRWKYRGQVRPGASRVVTIAEILERQVEGPRVRVRARATAWVDGMKIYEATIGTTLIREQASEQVLDPETDLVLRDHCPTYVVPALPLMGMADRLLNAVGGADDAMGALVEVSATRWLVLTEAVRARHRRDGERVVLEAWTEGAFRPIAAGRCGNPAAIHVPVQGELRSVHVRGGTPDLYREGHLFHGPCFQVLTHAAWRRSGGLGRLELPADVGDIAMRRMVLLDGVTHIIPNDALETWVPGWSADLVGYPTGLESLRIHQPLGQAGVAHVVVACTDADPRRPKFAFRISLGPEGEQGLWAEGVLIYIGLPKGPLGRLPAVQRRRFLAEGLFVAGAGLARATDGATVVDLAAVRASDWLPGTLAAAYGCAGLSGAALARTIAVKEHIARAQAIHPRDVAYDPTRGLCRIPGADTAWPVRVTETAGQVIVADATDAASLQSNRPS